MKYVFVSGLYSLTMVLQLMMFRINVSNVYELNKLLREITSAA